MQHPPVISPPYHQKHTCRVHGFTLIELSIVLVIIGLIVGGILVGQDLIKTATIRSQMMQIESYQTAVHTFRAKYNALPGDMQASKASAFGFQARAGAAGRGDGNNILEGCASANIGSGTRGGCEVILFWRDLSTAGLIKETFNTATDTAAGSIPQIDLNNVHPDLIWPKSVLSDRGRIIVYSGWSGDWAGGQGNNFFGLHSFQSSHAAGWMAEIPAPITPGEAYAIDNKMDDGLPVTGSVQAMYPPSANPNVGCLPGVAGGKGDGCCGNNVSGSVNMYTTVTAELAATKTCRMRFAM